MLNADSCWVPYGSRRIVVLPFCAIDGPPSGSAVRNMIRALALDSGSALEEPGHRHVVWQSIARAHIAGPGPGFIQREELVVRIRDDGAALPPQHTLEPPVILHREIGDLSHPPDDARLVSVNSIEWNRSVVSAFTRLLLTNAAPAIRRRHSRTA